MNCYDRSKVLPGSLAVDAFISQVKNRPVLMRINERSCLFRAYMIAGPSEQLVVMVEIEEC